MASTNTVRLEGVVVHNAVRLAANQFANWLVTITVADGRLTVDAGSSANLATRLTYTEVTRL